MLKVIPMNAFNKLMIKLKENVIFLGLKKQPESTRRQHSSPTMWMNLSLFFANQSTIGNNTMLSSTEPWVFVVFSLITFVSVSGNSLIIYAWHLKIVPRKQTFFYIANLAKSDLLLTLSSLLFLIQGKEVTLTGNIMCKTGQFLGEVSSFTSILTLVAIGHHRYTVMNSIRAPQIFIHAMEDKARKYCWAIWLTATIISAPVLCAFSMVYIPSSGALCVDTDIWPAVYTKVYYTFRFVLFFCLPLVLLLFSYFHIYFILRKRKRKLDFRNTFQRAKQTPLYVAIVTTFIFCVGPKIVARTVEQYKVWPADVSTTILYVAGLLLVAQPALNPIVSSASSREIRRAIKISLKCRGQSKKGNNTDNPG